MKSALKKYLSINGIFIVLLYVPTSAILYLAVTSNYKPTESFTLVRLIILILFVPIIFKYVLHLLIAPWYSVVENARSKKRPKDFLPSVTVLIPAWNEAVGIVHTIESVIATQYKNLEIIIVNDGSTDSTHNVITQFIADFKVSKSKTSLSIIYYNIKNDGKAKALNHALRFASNDIIITIDADSSMDKNAIHHLVKHFSDPLVASVAGNVVIGNRTRPIGLIQQLEYVYGFYFKRADSLLNAVYIVGGAAAAYRKEVITRTGGFDESIITEGIELSTRLQDQGYKVRYAAEAIVYTEGPQDFEGLCKQRLRWKFGRLLTFYKYRHLFFSFKREHNQYLTFIVLPIAFFAEILLFFEGLLLAAFYIYTFYTNDFVPLAFVILALTLIVFLQILSDPKTRYHSNLFFLAPSAWILFYVMDLVEYQALIRSGTRIIQKKQLVWQKWQRVGVFNS